MKEHTLSRMIILAGMVLACATTAMAADETLTFTGLGDGKIGSGSNWSPDLGNNTVAQRRHFIVDNNTNNNLLLDTNNTWLDDGTTVDPTDPAVNPVKWGGKSMELSGTGYVSYQALSKNDLWNVKNFRIGEVGVGFLDQSGGTMDLSPGNADASLTVKAPGELRIGGFDKNGVDWNGIGTYTMTGGLLTNNGLGGQYATSWVRLGEGGTGTMSIGGTAVVDLAAVQANGVVSTNLAAMTLSANVVDTGTNNALLEIIGTDTTVNIDTLAMMGGLTNTIKFDLDGGAVSPINVAGAIADAGGVGVYIASGSWIELTGHESLAPGAVIDLIDTTNGFFGAETLALTAASADHFSLGLDGTGKILQATAVSQFTWDGGSGSWSDANWGGVTPEPNQNMIIDAADSVVTVAADFTTGSGTGPARFVDLGASNAASLIVNSGVTLEATAAVNVGGSGTLQVDGTLAAGSLATAESSTLGGSGTIEAAEVMIGGTIAPGNSLGVLTLDVPDDGAELADSAVYRCEIGADDAPIANDVINAKTGDFAIGGKLELVATSKLRGPDESGEWFGEQTRAVVSAEGDNSVMYYFATPPTPLPEDFGTAEWGEGHIGRGVFLTRENIGGANDAPGVSYTAANTTVHLFQAIDGDTNGNAILDTADIFSILGAGSFLKPGEWDWTEGDFDGDKDVDTTDIFAILATGKWGNFAPYYPEPVKGSAAKGDADAVVDLIVNAKTGEVSVDTNGAEITGYVISSDSGALTGSAATQFTLSEQTSAQIADMLPLGKAFAGVHDLGSVLAGDGGDLTLTYTLAGQAGVFKGNVQVVPEPCTLAMLLGTGLLGLLTALRRRHNV